MALCMGGWGVPLRDAGRQPGFAIDYLTRAGNSSEEPASNARNDLIGLRRPAGRTILKNSSISSPPFGRTAQSRREAT